MTTGNSDWDEHVALACYRYNTGICSATGVSPYKAMFEIKSCEAWGEMDLDRMMREGGSLAARLSLLHKRLLN